MQPIAPHEDGWNYGVRADAEARHSEIDWALMWNRMPYFDTTHQDLFTYAQAMFANEQAYGEWLRHHHELEPGRRG